MVPTLFLYGFTTLTTKLLSTYFITLLATIFTTLLCTQLITILTTVIAFCLLKWLHSQLSAVDLSCATNQQRLRYKVCSTQAEHVILYDKKGLWERYHIVPISSCDVDTVSAHAPGCAIYCLLRNEEGEIWIQMIHGCMWIRHYRSIQIVPRIWYI